MAMDENALNTFSAQAMERQAPRGYSVQAEQHGQARQGNTSPDMERCIQLTDINPQSVSVPTANMASLELETTFASSSISAITAAGGSLNFLTREGVADMGDELVGRNGAQSEMLVIDPRTVGIICNNDPYFRPRGGARSPIDSKAMATYRRHANRRVKDVANGPAGLATFMHVIEHEMLGKGCPHGKVLPLPAARSDAYKGFRRNIENEYCDVIAISTASGDGLMRVCR